MPDNMMVHKIHATRGQVFPVYLGTIFLVISCSFFILNYGNVVATQIRAQNAADSAASAIVAIQAQEFDQEDELLYAADVEEYRIRHLLEFMRLTVIHSGGCNNNPVSVNSCANLYSSLSTFYLKALQRYYVDVTLLNQVSFTASYTNVAADANVMLNRLRSHCLGTATTSNSLDCGFSYSIAELGIRANPKNALAFPQGFQLPSFVKTNTADATPIYMAPINVDVAVCAHVKPFLANFWFFSGLPQITVIARGAATDAMVVQDWMQPGQITNPQTGKVYQRPEVYGPGQWYTVNYGGNIAQADITNNAISAAINGDEFSTRVGWWGAMSIHPFAGPKTRKELFADGTC